MGLRLTYNAPVTLTFGLIAVGLFYLNAYVLGGSITHMLALSGYWDWGNIVQYPTILTYTLGHADEAHLFGNMSLFLLLGPIMEEKYGTRNVLIMMIITAFLSGICQLLFFDFGLRGASGIVFMFIILVSFANAKSGTIPLTFILVALLFIGKEILAMRQADNISQFAHIAGGVFGAVFGFGIEKAKSS